MLLKETIIEILKEQEEKARLRETGIPRDLAGRIETGGKMVLIISGIRRCGKSTLLRQLMNSTGTYCYFNFEDILASNFEFSDFRKLDSIIRESYSDASLYFDEIQTVQGWEKFVRSAQDDGCSIVITGSNASLLSKDLGTKLTGRHLTYELFPFSYEEFLEYKRQEPGIKSFKDYFISGGFPEFIKNDNPDILQQLFRDILYRDVVVRHGLKNASLAEKLATYLITNAGKKFSYTSLKKTFETGSANTIIDYIAFFEDSYLMMTIPPFSYSLKEQIRNPKKIYAIDHGLARVNSLGFSKDEGRILENLVFLHLRRNWSKIFYFSGKRECDFIVFDREKITLIVQVCHTLTDDNQQREISGLTEAMAYFKVGSGYLITFNQEDIIESEGITINIIPAWKWISSHPA